MSTSGDELTLEVSVWKEATLLPNGYVDRDERVVKLFSDKPLGKHGKERIAEVGFEEYRGSGGAGEWFHVHYKRSTGGSIELLTKPVIQTPVLFEHSTEFERGLVEVLKQAQVRQAEVAV